MCHLPKVLAATKTADVGGHIATHVVHEVLLRGDPNNVHETVYSILVKKELRKPSAPILAIGPA